MNAKAMASRDMGSGRKQSGCGFKQTAIGLLPADWDTKRLANLANVVRGASPRPAGDPRYFSGAFIPWLTVAALTNIPEWKMYVSETSSFLTQEGSRISRTLNPGIVIIANSGATLGVAKILGIKCCANDGIAALLNQNEGNEQFVCYYLNTLTTYLREVVAPGNGQPNLNTTLIGRIEISWPPNSEQRAIAGALSDVDALIGALEKFIAKKRAIKLATMQRLLTAKNRLPGFSGRWKPINIGEKSSIKARIGWQGLTTAEYRQSGDYRLVTGTDFEAGRVDWSRCVFVDKSRYVQDSHIQLKIGDVLVTKDGTIGKSGFVDRLPGPVTLNSGVFVIRPKNGAYDPLYLYYVLTSNIFAQFLARLQAGSTIVHLYQKDFVGFDFEAPAVTEQSAIARVLSEMDAEIASLERRRDKTKAIKQGMVQALLTGRIRLLKADT